MQFLFDYLKGILIGSGAILPGISSGVFCVIFGIYEKLVNSVLNIFNDFRKNFKFLLPIVLGSLTGVLLVGKLLNFLFNSYQMPTKFCFIGLILGSIPVLFKRANNGKGFRLHYLLYLLFAFLIGVLSIKLDTILPNLIQIEMGQNFFFYLIFAGFVMSIGIVVPGVSSSVILMLLGVYSTYLTAVANVQFSILLPLAIGIICGGIIFLKVIQFLLNHFYSQTFYTIIGFVLGSILILYPGFSFNVQGLISILLFAVCFFVGLQLGSLDS